MHCLLLNRVPQETVQDVIAANTHGISSQAHHGTVLHQLLAGLHVVVPLGVEKASCCVVSTHSGLRPESPVRLPLCRCPASSHSLFSQRWSVGIRKTHACSHGLSCHSTGQKEESTQNPQRNTTLSNGCFSCSTLVSDHSFDLRLASMRVWDQFGIKMAFFDVSAHTLHSLGQVTVTVKRILVQGLGFRV